MTLIVHTPTVEDVVIALQAFEQAQVEWKYVEKATEYLPRDCASLIYKPQEPLQWVENGSTFDPKMYFRDETDFVTIEKPTDELLSILLVMKLGER